MLRLPALTIASLAAGLATACTVLTSDLPSELAAGGAAPNGHMYALPRGIIEFVLTANPDNATFKLWTEGPTFVADPNHRYVLRYRPLPQYEDKITITMNKNGKPFLKMVKADTTDKTKDVIINLASTVARIGGFEADVPSTDIVLASRAVDPGIPADIGAAEAALNRTFSVFVREQDGVCKAHPPPKNAKGEYDDAGKARLKVCGKYRDFVVRTDASARRAGAPVILIAVKPPTPIVAIRPADCSIGLCYRPREPFTLTYSLDGAVNTQIVSLPNMATPISIDITRAFFVNKVQQIDFDDNGFFSKMTIDKQSELAALASLPADVLSEIAKSLQLRVQFLESQKQSADGEVELIKARNQLQKARAAYEASIRDDARRGSSPGLTSGLVRVPVSKEQASSEGAGGGPDLGNAGVGVGQK